MSFYRTLIAAVAAAAIAIPAFAADEAAANANASQPQQVADSTTTQSTDSSMQQSGTTDQTAATAEKVDLNKATAKELMKVKGISASKARNIVSYRKKHGDFKSVDELANVKGFKKMKPDMLKEIEDQLTVG